MSIFDAWPPSQQSAKGGDTIYWNDLPCNVLSAIERDKLAVWPILSSSASDQSRPTVYSDLGSLLVATEMDNRDMLAALASAGVNITLPPTYVKDLLLGAEVHFTSLTPETARQTLLVSY
jgi:hypothetical protein